MMIGDGNNCNDPTVDVPPWPDPDDLTANMHLYLSPPGGSSNFSPTSFKACMEEYSRLFQQSNDVVVEELDSETSGEVSGSRGIDLPVDVYSCDNFRMYEFKVRKCARGRSHDWTECPYAHPGEKARRRDPSKYHYSGTACAEFRKGSCRRGDVCEFAHGVFECWLHPTRYRTQPCKDGLGCKRRVCFFAHSPEQLRVLSPNGGAADSFGRNFQWVSSPESSGSPPTTESPPMSPMTTNSVNEMVASLRQLQLSKVKSIPSSWNIQMGSPRIPVTRPGFLSLPSTPTGAVTRPAIRSFDMWDREEPVMERVESGRDLRVKLFEKLSKENPLDGVNQNVQSGTSDAPNPDVDWVSDLIQ